MIITQSTTVLIFRLSTNHYTSLSTNKLVHIFMEQKIYLLSIMGLPRIHLRIACDDSLTLRPFSDRKHRWAEFNRAIHTKIMPDNPISKAKEEKNRLQIAQVMILRL